MKNFAKDIRQNRKYGKLLVYALIFLYSVLFLAFISYGENPFLQDDNGLQWNPVIEAAFREFFSTGHVPQYNFFQLKGYDIFQVGYYGLYNPLMYLAYLCSVIFRTNPLCVYTYISFILGNYVVYFLGRKSKCSETTALLVMFLYSVSGIFFYYAYWYYSMENYWFVPLTFLLFLSYRGGRRNWYQYGLLMAVSVYLGNIQFTMYHWMLCGIVMAVIWLVFARDYWKKILSNIGVALLFSAPALLRLLAAAGQSNVYGEQNTYFFAYPVKFKTYLEECLFGNLGMSFLLLCLFFVGAVFLIRKRKEERGRSYQDSVLLASGVVFVFFLLFLGGEDYILAKVLYLVPGLSSMRYLMKLLLILPGSALPIAFYAVCRLTEKKRENSAGRIVVFYFMVLLFFCIGVLQCKSAYEAPMPGKYGGKTGLDAGSGIKAFRNSGSLDFDNYRVVNLITGINSYNFEQYYTETHNVDSLLVGNLGTKLSVFSLGGYDNTYQPDSLSSVVNLYREDMDVWQSMEESEMYSVRNTVSIRTLMRNIYRQGDYNEKARRAIGGRFPDWEILKTEYQYDEFGICKSVVFELKKGEEVRTKQMSFEELGIDTKSADVFETLMRNGVRYLLYDKSAQSQVDAFLAECNALGIGYGLGDISRDCKYIELYNAMPIAFNQSLQLLPIKTSGIDRLEISIGEEDIQCHLNMTYNEGIRAEYHSYQNIDATELEVGSDADNNIVISVEQCGSGVVVVTYRNMGNQICLIFLLLLCLAVVISFVFDRKPEADKKICDKINALKSIKDRLFRKSEEGKNNELGKKGIFLFMMAVLGIYAVYMLRVSIHTEALVPDERWFLNILEGVDVSSIKDYLTLPNYLGYGPIYWFVMGKLGSFLAMRIFCCLLLLSVIPAVFLTVFLHNGGAKEAKKYLPALLMIVSCPLSWFTGKMIGPEIIGYAVGVWGCTIGIFAIVKERKRYPMLLLSGLLSGIAVGIKLYYAVFCVFVGIYLLLFLRKQRHALKNIVAGGGFFGLGVLLGFFISSPVYFFDHALYMSAFEDEALNMTYSLTYLKEVFLKKYIEWDFVNFGGLNYTILSFIVFVVFLCIGIWECFAGKRKQEEIESGKGEKNVLFLAGYLSIAVLFFLCSKEVFYGWYLLPVIYFVAVSLTDRKLVYLLLALNLFLMAPNLYFQVYAKEAQIYYAADREQMESVVKRYAEIYEGYRNYVFVDNEIGGLPLDVIFIYSNAHDEKEILFISDKALKNARLNELHEDALHQRNGYRDLTYRNGIHVILYERGT